MYMRYRWKEVGVNRMQGCHSKHCLYVSKGPKKCPHNKNHDATFGCDTNGACGYICKPLPPKPVRGNAIESNDICEYCKKSYSKKCNPSKCLRDAYAYFVGRKLYKHGRNEG